MSSSAGMTHRTPQKFEAAAGKLWVFKPKFHLFQDMCEFQGGNPGLLWTYTMKTLEPARRRGGVDKVFVAAVPQWLSEKKRIACLAFVVPVCFPSC